MAIPSAPTGLTVETFRNKIELRWVANPDSEKVQGYNVYNSTTSGGGVSGYVKLNNALIEESAEVKEVIQNSSSNITEESTGTDETKKTTVTIQNIEEVAIFLYTHENLTLERTQYYVVTAVNDLGEESAFSIEIKGTPIIISTELVDAPIRSQNDVSLDYITTLLEREPELDVKPGSVTRQLHVDPNSHEFYLAYIRIDFAFKSQSFLSLREIDDPNGDGVSDPVSDVNYKQLLKTAFFYETDDEVQNLIDSRFDALAANFATFRIQETSAQTTLVFYSETAPTSDITVPLGTEASTIPTENESAVVFTTLSTSTMDITDLTRYFNQATQRYELRIPAEAVIAGANGNVNSETLVSSSISGLRVTNPSAAFGGQDQESNSNLADRALLAIVGLDLGTIYGYKRTVAAIPNVLDEKIIDAGHPLMMRDYDEVRKKHVFGKVDIYIRGGQPIEYQDTFGFLFQLKQEIQATVNDATKFIIEIQDSNISSTTEVVSLKRIYNVSRVKDYDLTGSWMLYKNGTEMKRLNSEGILENDVRIDLETGSIIFLDPLTTGDVITADYFYKIAVTDEEPTSIGSKKYTLLHEPIRQSYQVYKETTSGTTLLTEDVDYKINLLSRTITLTNSLATSETLLVDYSYVGSQILGEVVVSSATSGQTTATFANTNILESYIIVNSLIYINYIQNTWINAAVGISSTDEIETTYRLENDSAPYTFVNQPVDSIVSVSGAVSGTIPSNQYQLNKYDDILLEGNSVESARTLQFLPTALVIGDSINFVQENVVLLNFEGTELSNKGIAIETIVVKDLDTRIVYTEGRDYRITEETNENNVEIFRTTISRIPNDGRTLEISYEYGELFTVNYTANPLIKEVQDEIEDKRHLTADVLVKGASQVLLDFELGVVVEANSDQAVVSSDIKTAISNEINKLKMGEDIAQSDIIRAVELVNNVVSVVVPLTKMVKADGIQVIRERIEVEWEEYQQNQVISYTTGVGALKNSTNGSTSADGFYGIFENDRPLTLTNNKNIIDTASGLGIITTDGEVVISPLESGTDPNDRVYTVSYVVQNETGASDIEVTDLEFLAVNDIIVNIVEERTDEW